MKSYEFKEAGNISAAGAARRGRVAPTTLRVVVQKGRLRLGWRFGCIYMKKMNMETYQTRPVGEKPKDGSKKSVLTGGVGEVA